MKPTSLISTGVLLLFAAGFTPTYAQQEQHEQEAKPEKQEQQAKPQKQEQAKPVKDEKQAQPTKPEQEAQAKPKKQEQARPVNEHEEAQPAKQKQQAQAKPEEQQQAKSTRQEHVQPVKAQRPEQAQGQWARNGQKDSRGHEYNESRFGPDHHARFEQNGGRFYNGRREYSYGGYWFYAGVYPPWFYQQDVYFIMAADGLWYAVAYGDPSLTFQVYID